MLFSNEKKQNSVVIMKVKFILRADRQHILIDFLKNNTLFDNDALAHLLNTTPEKISAIHEKQDFFGHRDAKKLVKFFSLFCGS